MRISQKVKNAKMCKMRETVFYMKTDYCKIFIPALVYL